MDIRLTKQRSSVSRITAISSKSYVHRLIVSAALYGGASIKTNILSNDMRATVNAVRSLGGNALITENADGTYEIEINESLKRDEGRICTVDCGESGSTARFILPLAPFFAKEAIVTGSGRLPERPMGPLCDVLRLAGVSVLGDTLPIRLAGMPVAGDYSIAGNVSSQFISGLLFLLPLLEKPSSLTVTGKFESAAYVDMTVDVLKKFGADIDFKDSVFYVNQSGRPPISGQGTGKRDYTAEGDWSNAAYLLAIAALGCGVLFDRFTVDGLSPNSIQGDRAIVDIMRQFGIEVDITENGCTVSGRPKGGVDVDCSQIPDLVPALAVLAANVDDKSVFRNVERLRLKECDRVMAVCDMLDRFGIEVNITQNGDSEDMTVSGKGAITALQPVKIRSYNDHRIAMAAAAFALASDQPVVIEDAMAVDKSFPGFYEVIGKMGIGSSNV
ncbi:MAG: 3-phosphoshikimate 1-carboxyvinyltransferase [Lachnospiraceae bacterium]|nr:3-phosphoshikimate 1-carboxyvinyltransferase [Lachnospiraceae bacterium]